MPRLLVLFGVLLVIPVLPPKRVGVVRTNLQ